MVSFIQVLGATGGSGPRNQASGGLEGHPGRCTRVDSTQTSFSARGARLGPRARFC